MVKRLFGWSISQVVFFGLLTLAVLGYTWATNLVVGMVGLYTLADFLTVIAYIIMGVKPQVIYRTLPLPYWVDYGLDFLTLAIFVALGWWALAICYLFYTFFYIMIRQWAETTQISDFWKIKSSRDFYREAPVKEGYEHIGFATVSPYKAIECYRQFRGYANSELIVEPFGTILAVYKST